MLHGWYCCHHPPTVLTSNQMQALFTHFERQVGIIQMPQWKICPSGLFSIDGGIWKKTCAWPTLHFGKQYYKDTNLHKLGVWQVTYKIMFSVIQKLWNWELKVIQMVHIITSWFWNLRKHLSFILKKLKHSIFCINKMFRYV